MRKFFVMTAVALGLFLAEAAVPQVSVIVSPTPTVEARGRLRGLLKAVISKVRPRGGC